jgi:hypothetical protein
MGRNRNARRLAQQRRGGGRGRARARAAETRRPPSRSATPNRTGTDAAPATPERAGVGDPVDRPAPDQAQQASNSAQLPPMPPDEAVEALIVLMAPRVARRWTDPVRALGRLIEVEAAYPAVVERCLHRLLDHRLAQAWARGWQPVELIEYVRRQLGDWLVPFVRDSIANEHSRYSPATVHPRWRAQLDESDVTRWWRPGQSRLDQAAERYQVSRLEARVAAVATIGLLRSLPPLQRLLPLPGQASGGPDGRPSAGVSQKVLSRIRGLLAKAEATDYPEESDALSAKAQELMTKFSLDRAMVAASEAADVPDGPAARRIWLSAPYVSAKAHLVNAVAKANRCAAVTDRELGMVTMVGAETDLQLVELLVTSLLVQATREMLRAGRSQPAYGRTGTRSYRHAFLVSYAARIGERLRAAAAEVQEATGDARQLLPVLARQDEQVQALAAELFPNTVTRKISVSNQAGWAHGRAAADLANLDTRRGVRGR